VPRYRAYDLETEGRGGIIRAVPGSGLGILRGDPARLAKRLDAKALALARSPSLLILTKANSMSTVHRPHYLDYVAVKRFGPDGTVTGEHGTGAVRARYMRSEHGGALDVMKRIKNAMDPKGLLNPGKLYGP